MPDFVGRYDAYSQNTSSCLISWRSVNLLLRFGNLTAFKMAAGRLVGFFQKIKILSACHVQRSTCAILPNFVLLFQTIAEIWSFSIFQDGGHPPCRISKVWRANMCNCTKFHADWSNRCRDMAIFWDNER